MLYKVLTGRRRKWLIAGLIWLVLIALYKCLYSFQIPVLLSSSHDPDLYIRRGPFEINNVSGFANSAQPIRKACDVLEYTGIIGVQKSIILDNDFRRVAFTVDSHPKVVYNEDDLRNPDVSSQDLIDRHWSNMAGSSVWLPKQKVFLNIKRVIFGEIIMSWLWARVFDEDWRILDNHTVTFGSKSLTFPRVLEIESPIREEGRYYGPEDPRIIMEDVKGAEPIVIFNMIAPIVDWKRAMFIHRPFSNVTSLLTISNLERPGQEKNWAPFFVPEYTNSGRRIPSAHIHFLYNHKPLQILRCQLRCGSCDFVFKQQLPTDLFGQRREDDASLRGGTNLMPVPISLPKYLKNRVGVYVALSRTHVDTWCNALYRPELIVMVRMDDQFYIAFASKPLSLGRAVLDGSDDRCARGRIFSPNALARWDVGHNNVQLASTTNTSAIAYHGPRKSRTDVLTAIFYLDDVTIHVVRMSGLLDFVKGLPQIKQLQKLKWSHEGEQDLMLKTIMSAWVTWDLVGCLVEAAVDYKNAWVDGKGDEGAIPIKPPDKSSGLTWKEHDRPSRVQELDSLKNKLLQEHRDKERQKQEQKQQEQEQQEQEQHEKEDQALKELQELTQQRQEAYAEQQRVLQQAQLLAAGLQIGGEQKDNEVGQKEKEQSVQAYIEKTLQKEKEQSLETDIEKLLRGDQPSDMKAKEDDPKVGTKEDSVAGAEFVKSAQDGKSQDTPDLSIENIVEVEGKGAREGEEGHEVEED